MKCGIYTYSYLFLGCLFTQLQGSLPYTTFAMLTHVAIVGWGGWGGHMVTVGTGLGGTVLFSSSLSHVTNTYKTLKRQSFEQFLYECWLKYLSNAPCLQHICVLSVSIIAMTFAVLTSERTSVMHWKSKFNTVKVAVNLSVSLLHWVVMPKKKVFYRAPGS